ncbi:MAG: hypothetical protein KDA78_08825 [Planctomycetaceae bacterium]|nr:hypothetical protein [Planctomycetaceae bacterium]
MEDQPHHSLDYSQLPDQLKEVYEAIEDELIWLHGRWRLYRQLYGADQETLDLLNNSAPTFFGMLQFLWLDYVVLEICSLTDPPRSYGRDNLVLRQLYEMLDPQRDADLRRELRECGRSIDEACGKLRMIRNRRIAHKDQRTALGAYQSPILGVSRQDVEDALAAMRAYANNFRMHFLGSEMSYEEFILPDDARSLLNILQQVQSQ